MGLSKTKDEKRAQPQHVGGSAICHSCKNLCYMSVVIVDPAGTSRNPTFLLCIDCAIAEITAVGLSVDSNWTLVCRLSDEELEAIVSVAASKLPADDAGEGGTGGDGDKSVATRAVVAVA